MILALIVHWLWIWGLAKHRIVEDSQTRVSGSRMQRLIATGPRDSFALQADGRMACCWQPLWKLSK